MASMFFLGSHQPGWLTTAKVPLFISAVRLERYRQLPRAAAPWALDSGGFSQLAQYGTWTVSPESYAEAVRRYRDDIGQLEWAAPQDWMCEPFMVAKTGLSVAEHQRRTVENYLALRNLAPDLPFIPVLQGWELSDYLQCADMYRAAGIDLAAESVVGLGSVCRRQATGEATAIVRTLAQDRGLRLHGFGFKVLGLRTCGRYLTSSDSMAWSYDARRNPPLPGHETRHRNCANCPEYAVSWRGRIVEDIENRSTAETWEQMTLA